MKAISLERKIKKLGGTAEITSRATESGRIIGKLRGILNEHDIEMTDGHGFYVVRPISKRGEYDPSADYNPGGWTFCRQLKELEWAAE